MTTHERILRMYQHREADRVPIIDHPWRGAIARWEREGMKQATARSFCSVVTPAPHFYRWSGHVADLVVHSIIGL